MLSRLEMILFAILIFIMIIGFVLIGTQNSQIDKINNLEANIYNKITSNIRNSDDNPYQNYNTKQNNSAFSNVFREISHSPVIQENNFIQNNDTHRINDKKFEIDEVSIRTGRQMPNMPIIDPIKTYDYRVLDDPMKDPKRRISRYSLGNILPNPAFNFPTRGPQDTFSQQGYLVDKHASSDDPNKILQLFGRQKWANSNQYEYYVTFQSGVHERKYELEKYKKELYNKDEVKIDILDNRKYEVKLFKHETMDYNPYWI